jgi:hypothetical protein
MGAVGVTTVLPGSLAWVTQPGHNSIGPSVNVYFTSRDGTTTIRVEQKLSALVAGIYGGVGGGAGGGAVILPAAAVAVLSPVLIPIAVVAWLGGTYAVCRGLFRNRARQHAARVEKLLADLVRIAEKRIAAPG